MKALIIKRSKLADESLLLSTLTDQGEIKRLKIPGILKSRRRSSYSLAPGSIYEFTISQGDKEINIPREYHLAVSPFSESPTYKELERLAELVSPLSFLMPGIVTSEIYNLASTYITTWQNSTENFKEEMLNSFLLFFLNEMGLLLINTECALCSRELNKKDFYLLTDGGVCRTCLEEKENALENAISLGWVNYYSIDFFNRCRDFLSPKATVSPPLAEQAIYEHEVFKLSSHFREKIFLFLKKTLST